MNSAKGSLSVLLDILKITLGTILFSIILHLARKGQGRLVGMMLTFPALNGVGLITGKPQDLYIMEEAMVPMIVTNGILCATYIRAIQSINQKDKRIFSIPKSYYLIIFFFLSWIFIALYLPEVKISVEMMLLCYSILILPLLIFSRQRPSESKHYNKDNAPTNWFQTVKLQYKRLIFFFFLASFVMFLISIKKISLAGRFSAFPLIPFFTIFFLSCDDRESELQNQLIKQMARTVLLGPLVAMGFVAVFVYYLSNFLPNLAIDTDKGYYILSLLVGLILGWILCYITISYVARITSKIDNYLNNRVLQKR